MARLLSFLALICCLGLALAGCDLRKPEHKLTEEHRSDCLNATDYNQCRMKADQEGSYSFGRAGRR